MMVAQKPASHGGRETENNELQSAALRNRNFFTILTNEWNRKGNHLPGKENGDLVLVLFPVTHDSANCS